MSIVLSVVGKYDGKDLDRAQKALDKLRKEALLASSPIARVGASFEAAGKKMKKVGDTMSKKLTLPILGIAAAAGYAYKQVDDGLDTVAAKSGATGAQLKGLESTFKSVASNATQDMATVGDVVGSLAGRLKLTGKPLEQLSSQMLTLARVTKTDATSATDAILKSLKALGLPASQASTLMDELVVASQKSGIAVDELAGEIAATAPQFKTMGFGTKEQIAMLAAFNSAGLPATRMVAGLTAATANLAKKGVKDIPSALTNAIAKIKSAGSESEATAMAVNLFGARAGVALGKSIRNGTLNIDEMTKALKNSSGALKRAGDATMGPDEAMAQLRNQLTLAGAALAQGLTPLLQRLIPIISKVAGWFEQLSPGMQTFVGVTGLAVAALGPMLKVAGNISVVVGKLAQTEKLAAVATKIWTGIQAAFNLVMDANPVVLVTLAIAALVAGVVLAYQKFKPFRNFVDGTFRVIKNAAVGLFNWLKQNWPTLLAILTGPIGVAVLLISRNWDTIKNATATAFDWIKSKITTVVGGVIDFVKGIPGKIAAVPKQMVEFGKNLIEGIWNGITGTGSWFMDKIKEWVNDHIPGWMKKVLGIASPSKVTARIGEDIVNGMATGMVNRAEAVKRASKYVADTAVHGLHTTDLMNFMGPVANRPVFTAGKDSLDKPMKSLSTGVDKAAESFQKLKDAATNALDKIKSRAQQVVEFAKQISSALMDFGSVTSFDTSTPRGVTSEGVLANMANRLNMVKAFGDQLAQLKKLGLNNVSLQEIISAGPEAGSQIAAALLAAGKKAITGVGGVNDLERQLAAASASVGNTGAQSQYGMSTKTARGMLQTSVSVSPGAVVIHVGDNVDSATVERLRGTVQKEIRAAIKDLGVAVTTSKKSSRSR